MPHTISVVEDDIYFIEILKETIQKDASLSLHAIFQDNHSALEKFPLHPTDVMLIDVQLPDESGIHLIRKLKANFPLVSFIICTSHEEELTIFESFKAGACGYILKSDPFEKLTFSIHEAINGGAPMSAGVARKVVDYFYKSPNIKLDILSSKEKDLLVLLSEGKLYKEIADILSISLDTVKKHTGNIYKKLHVHNKTEAINVYLNR